MGKQADWMRCLCVAVACVVVGFGSIARAISANPAPSPVIAAAPFQAQLGSNGVYLGDNGRLHPFAQVDTHWVTNPAYFYNLRNSDLLSVGRLGVDGLLMRADWDLKFLGEFAYNKYWGVQEAATANFSGFTGHGNAEAILNKDGDLILRLKEDIVRANDVPNQVVRGRLLHWIESAHIAADWKPGGGALILSGKFAFFMDLYDRDNPVSPGSLDNWRYLPELRFAWKFLPKTSVFVQGNGQITRYRNAPYQDQNGIVPNANVRNSNGDFLSAVGGLAGSLSAKVTTLLQVGYSNSLLINNVDNRQTVTGSAILTYDDGGTTKISGGYTRSLVPASFFRYFILDRAHIRLDQQLADHTTFTLAPEYDHYTFGQNATTGDTRHDNQFIVGATLSQGIAEWLTLSLIERFDYRISDYKSGDAPTDFAGYTFNDVFLRIDVRY